MSSQRFDITIGSVGTVYFVPTHDDDLDPANFDPSAATTKQLIFKMPGAAGLLTRTAVAAQKTIDGVSVWGLQYTVLAADVVPYVSGSVGGFHQEAGTLSIEPFVQFSAGQIWPGSTVRSDYRGRTLRVVARLAA